MAKQQHEGVDGVRSFFWLFRKTLHLTFWLIGMLVLAMLADIIAAHFLWASDPVTHMENLVSFYLDQSTTPDLTQRAANACYWLAFGWNGIDKSVSDAANGVYPEGIMGKLTMEVIQRNFQDQLAVAMYGAKLFGLRAAMLAMVLPQFLLIVVVAFVDGQVARYIRRACIGPDSATRYHRAKYGFSAGLVPVVAIVWLIAPFPLPIHWLFFPVALLTGFAVWAMAKWYKKYY